MTVTFRRPATSRILGLLMYGVIVPVLGIFLVTMVGGLTAVALGGTPFELLAAPLTFCVLAPLTFTWLIRFAIRDYRRRAGMEVVIGPEQILINNGTKQETIVLAEVSALRISSRVGHHGCTLILDSGQRREFPSDIAPFAEVRAALEKFLLPLLEDRVDKALAAGEAVQVHDNRLRAGLQILLGMLLIPLSLVLLVTIHYALEGFSLFATGRKRIRAGWRGLGGGFVISQDGIRSRHVFGETPWEQIASARQDDCGIVITTSVGDCYSASSYATNGWAAAGWLTRRVPQVE